ncbi:MAG TPA: peptide-methionine (R)-S-oxide reductase MsrB [Candidatus Saccharimonadales bacterium]|nr:peptide-methionine (R)-S-oxide reductase MsrB [Candidatus Saccharimonadales bacterium]
MKAEDELRDKLGPAAYDVMRGRGTEAPFSGALLNEHRDGSFSCRVCGSVIFKSDSKFDSGSGWPSFSEPANQAAVKLSTDKSHGMLRTEVSCASCGSHLGHVFDDGPVERGGQRYCVNSVCFDFKPNHNG